MTRSTPSKSSGDAARSCRNPAAEEPAGRAGARRQQGQPRPEKHALHHPADLRPVVQRPGSDGPAGRAEARLLARSGNRLLAQTLVYGRAEEAPPRRDRFPPPAGRGGHRHGRGPGLEPHRALQRCPRRGGGRCRSRSAVPGPDEPCQKLDGGPGLAGRSRGSAVPDRRRHGAGHRLARGQRRHDRGARQWSGCLAARPRAPVRGLPLIGPHRRHRPRPCHCQRAGAGPWRRHPAGCRGGPRRRLSHLDSTALPSSAPAGAASARASRAIMLPPHRALVITAPSRRDRPRHPSSCRRSVCPGVRSPAR